MRGRRPQCPACRTPQPIWADLCTKCGYRLHSEASIKNRGIVLIVLGLLLTAGIGYIGLFLMSTMMHSGDAGATTRFTGTKADAALILALIGVLFSFGIAILVSGIWQFVYARRNQKLMVVALALVALAWVIGSAFMIGSSD